MAFLLVAVRSTPISRAQHPIPCVPSPPQVPASAAARPTSTGSFWCNSCWPHRSVLYSYFLPTRESVWRHGEQGKGGGSHAGLHRGGQARLPATTGLPHCQPCRAGDKLLLGHPALVSLSGPLPGPRGRCGLECTRCHRLRLDDPGVDYAGLLLWLVGDCAHHSDGRCGVGSGEAGGLLYLLAQPGCWPSRLPYPVSVAANCTDWCWPVWRSFASQYQPLGLVLRERCPGCLAEFWTTLPLQCCSLLVAGSARCGSPGLDHGRFPVRVSCAAELLS